MKKRILPILLAVSTSVSALAGEAELLAILKSGTASRFDKSDACRQLAICATKTSVPTLAALLTDPDLSHMARYALEPLKDPSVDDALRDALGKTSGNVRAGIIHSLGVRRDAKAVPALIALLPDPFAASALARIGTPDAIAAIEKALPATAAACLLAAETNPSLYEKLIAANIPPHIRIGAMAGAIRARGADGIPTLVQLLHGDDPAMFGVALRLTREWNEPKLTAALAAEIAKLPSDRQELLVRALGDRGDRAVVPSLLALRTAASIQALVQLGATAAVPMFVELALSGRELAPAAQAALVSLPGKEAEEAILGLLGHADAKIRALGITLVSQRRISGATPALLKTVTDADDAVRAAAVKALGETASAKEFPSLVELLLKAKSFADAEAAESALTAVCVRESKPTGANVTVIKAVYGDLPNGRSADVTDKVAALVKKGEFQIEASNQNFGDPAPKTPKKLTIEYNTGSGIQSKTVAEGDSIALSAVAVPPAITDALCAALSQAVGPAKVSLLRVLRSAGGPRSLAAIRAAATDANTEVRDTALRAICDWPSPDALPDLINLARTSSDPKFKILALRGWLRLAPQQEAPAETKLSSLKTAEGLITRDDERRLLLSALSQIPSAASLAMILPHLDSPRLKEEAAMAAVSVAEKIAKAHPTEVTAAMQKVLAVSKNNRTTRNAEIVLAETGKAAK